MNEGTLIIVVTSPTGASTKRLREMLRKAKSAPIDFVELALTTRSQQLAPTDPDLPRVTYIVRAPFTFFTDLLIKATNKSVAPGKSKVRGKFSFWAQRWLSSFAWRADKMLWLLPATQQLGLIAHQLSTIQSVFGDTYLIYTDEWHLPLAIEVVDYLEPDGAGSVEILDLILDKMGFASDSRCGD